MKKTQLLILFLVYGLVGFSQEYNERYELVNLGRKVNTGYHEGAPVISADGKTLYFFVHNHPANTYGKEGSQDIWYSELGEDGEWGEAKHMGKPLNQHHSNQVFTVMPDGNTLFIRGGSSRNSKGFAFTRRDGKGEWGKPDEIKVEGFQDLNKGKFYGATMSSDGLYMILYLSEKINSTFSDLYMSKAIGDGKWSRPVKIGPNINTERDEFAPYLAPDNKTMYFSSNRKDMGIGDADIYKTVRLDDTWLKWSDPVNVGRPLNTRAFDSYMSIDQNNNVFTSQAGDPRDGGNLDIFRLRLKDITIRLRGIVVDQKSNSGLTASLAIGNGEADTLVKTSGEGAYQIKLVGEGNYHIRVTAADHYPDEAQLVIKDVFRDTTVIQDFFLRPVKRNVLLTGTTYNSKTEEPIETKLEINLKRDRKGQIKKNTKNGYYETELEKKGWYFITASSEGFLNATDSVEHGSDEVTLLTKDIYLTPIEVGTTVRLNNIFFDFDKTTLKPESYVELDKVVEFLQNNSTVEIEIAGHTDSKGSDDYNLNLSQGRAQAVVDYLISQGIDDYRLIARGYGETVPLETNETDEGRAVNRRVEFTVLKK
ncbi:OmpA/MotB [Fulvivirga imtechensis AK7]|uniref:OmpA/MotB n=1 Tax=Fulvivirga imtechensis AK7 TaxID=1237149 RepID=L8JNE5_9BACT|nr:OmpA family protein [Fulvivirga imtechensis]ELR68892.1 OmpA/MotB [Fulvivirga imtechensis AK7]